MASPLVRKIGRAERALTPHNIAHQIDAIRAKIDEIIQGIANLNANVAAAPGSTPIIPYGAVPVGLTANSVLAGGVSNNVARIDHVHSVASAAPSGYFGTNYSIGVGAGFMRADAVLKYPDSLGVNATPITDLLVLSDDGTEGALLTASNTFSVNAMALKAPNATNTLRVGIYGNLALGGNATLTDNVLVGVSKTNYSASGSPSPIGLNFSITNLNVGDTSGAARGVIGAIVATMANAGGVSTNPAIGCTLSVTGGALTNNNFQGTVSGYITNQVLSALTIGTPAVLMEGYRTSGAVNRIALTDYVGYRSATPTVGFSGTITNVYGFLCNALTTGTNRYGLSVAAISGGTIATGVEIATHSGGTTRRAVRGGNTLESTANDFLCSTAAKGFIAKDAAGTPHFWRYTVAADGTPAIVDIGATAPTT